MQIRVLVVEDKQSLNQSMVNMLNKEGYNAFGTADIAGAKEVFLKEKPHIILLDIMLPQGNGYELIPFFRNHLDSRILMLTALDDVQSKCICYENGADDYIIKPFDLYELLYKLNAVRRRILYDLKEYLVGDITFNVETHRLTCKEKNVVIQPSQIRFLKLLYMKYIENSYVDKIQAVEGACEDVDESPRLQTLVARLRKNLSYIGSEQIEIMTVYGKGYMMVVRTRERNQ